MNEPQNPSPAEIYEAFLVPGIHARWTPVFLDHAQPGIGEHVLDLACGTGIVARHAAARVGDEGGVTGLDINPDMLAVARRAAAEEGVVIEWIEGDAVSPPAGPFDLVLCQQGLQFFPDSGEAARRMHGVLAPGGRAAVSVWQGLEVHPLYRALIEAQARYLDTAIENVGSPFVFGGADRLRAELSAAGFKRVDIADETRTVRFPSPERFVALTLLAGAAFLPEDELDADARTAMVEEISREVDDVLQEYVSGDAVSFPMHAHIAVARA